MTGLLVGNPATITPYAAAHALAAGPCQRAVLIGPPQPGARDRDATAAETRPAKETR